jgi:hypothetical protein
MRAGLAALTAAWTMLTMSGCATIMDRGLREIPIASQPPGAKVSIYNRSNVLVTSQTAPFVAELKPKHRFFVGQRYRVVFEMEGYQTAEVQLKPRISAWYFSNIFLGGPLGMLIVDPATGAMYRLLPEEVDQVLTPLPSSTPAPAPEPTERLD